MIGEIPTVTFDTSAHNELPKDQALSEAILAGIRSGYRFRFAGLSIEEIVACPDTAKRLALWNYCGRIREGSSDVIYPHNELIRLLILAHSMSPTTFDWRTVNVRAWEYEREMGRPEFVSDEELVAKQREEQFRVQKQYRKMFTDMRPDLTAVYERHGEPLPRTLDEVITRLHRPNSKLIWSIGKMLYDRTARTELDESAMNAFIEACPPFRAILYGMILSHYDIALRDRHTGEKFQSGRNDMFMSVYLPYCDYFITAEEKGEQEKCLRKIVELAGLKTEVLSYDTFCNSFLVSA
jgi:hypothetical protein